MFVRHRAHHAADGQAVEVVINEDQASQHHCGQLGPYPGLDVGLGPPAKGGRAAGPVHQAYHGPQNHKEYKDTHIVTVRQGGHDPVQKDMADRSLKAKVGVEQTAHQNPDEQGGVHLLGDQGQGNGNHRGEQAPHRIIEMAGGLHIPGSPAGGTEKAAPAIGTRRVLAIAGHAQACLVAVCTDDHFAAGFLCGVPRCGYCSTQSSYQHHQDSQQRQPSWKTFSHMVLSLLSFCSLIVAPFKKMSTKFSVFLETDERPSASPQAKL